MKVARSKRRLGRIKLPTIWQEEDEVMSRINLARFLSCGGEGGWIIWGDLEGSVVG